jgi:FlaA1/EpsC-like NDP-sugar epimerase
MPRLTAGWRERLTAYFGRRHTLNELVPVLIYGAGRRGKSILKELKDNRALGLHAIGLLDDNPDLMGLTINRVRILGSSRDLPTILGSQKVSALIISTYKITSERLVPVMNLCSEQRIPVLRGEFHLDRVSPVKLSALPESSNQKPQVGGVPHRSPPKVNLLSR